MKNSDRELVKQMISAGRYNAVLDFMPAVIDADAKDMVESMGTKWCCAKENQVKRLDVPVEILRQNQPKVLKKK